MSRHLKRQRERQLRKLGESVLRQGFPEDVPKEIILGLALIIAREIDVAANSADAGSRAAAVAHAAIQVSIRKTTCEVPLACGKGCNFCCHTYLSALGPEVLRIAREVRGRPDTARIVEALGATAGKTHAERHGARLPCGLLVSGLCSVYEVRPTICRKTVSARLDDCRAVFEGREAGWTTVKYFEDAARAIMYALCVALHSRGLPWFSYEMSGALRAALLDPDCERRWLAGEDVFAGVRRDTPPPGFVAMLERDASEISR